ncbi:MAG: transcriptional repressor [Deltaproteobacteria bacterium]|nr:transcriptional repressor [Deltaproteobacteria bacterium]
MERITSAVKAAGVKLTIQRLEIFRELAASADHPSAEAVFEALHARMPTVSLDTVYRTLWLLTDLGLVHTLGPRHESVRFDPKLERHHHFVCLRCGLVRDFESAELDALRVPASAARFGRVEATHVEVRGVCSGCARKQGRKSGGRNDKEPKGGKGSNEHE